MQVPINDAQWKEHQQIKNVRNADDLNEYAGELATEMRIYTLNRLENVRDNIHAIIKRLKTIKPKKKTGKRNTFGKKSVKAHELE